MRLKSGNKGTQYGFEILHCKLLRPCLGLGQKKEWLLMVVTVSSYQDHLLVECVTVQSLTSVLRCSAGVHFYIGLGFRILKYILLSC